MTRLRVLIAAALLAAGALACGSARRSEPLVGRFVPPTADAGRGERVFMTRCHACHPGGEAGLGPALNDKPLPGFLIAMQVRAGLGAMPAFSADELPAADLDAVIVYLAARRRM